MSIIDDVVKLFLISCFRRIYKKLCKNIVVFCISKIFLIVEKIGDTGKSWFICPMIELHKVTKVCDLSVLGIMLFCMTYIYI